MMPPLQSAHDILIDVIGDSGPFSLIGKSIGYRITAGNDHYLLDCGAPVFQLLGTDGIQSLRGIFATHSHEDHRRWFTDLALFKRYTPGCSGKLRLVTTDTIHDEFHKNSKGALERSLSGDSRTVIDMPYLEFVEQVTLGPRPLYRVVLTDSPAGRVWRVLDRENRPVPPQQAKIFINPEANRPRLLFRDPATQLWVEPESYYAFSDTVFYTAERNVFTDAANGLQVEALKEPAWHGPPTIALRFTRGETRVVFSSDTVYDPALWRRLVSERRPQKGPLTGDEFLAAPVVYGNINDYIEQTWSERRLQEALHAYDDAVLVHDVDYNGSIVHTSYRNIAAARSDPSLPTTLLTHSPDRFVSLLPLAASEKSYRVRGRALTELTDHGDFPLDADCFIKEEGKLFAGYRNPNGLYAVVESDRGFAVRPRSELRASDIVFTVDLYQDISGGYFRRISDDSERYHVRPDGTVELLHFSVDGSRGELVTDQRPLLSRQS